jgi:hypothetical protein
MYGLFIGLVALICLGLPRTEFGQNDSRYNDAPVTTNIADVESQADGIAASIQYAMSDVAAACIEQPRATLPAGCTIATAGISAITTDSMQALDTVKIYAAGTTLGRVKTFYVPAVPVGGYLVSAWLPPNAGAAAKYCGMAFRDLLRTTNNSQWVALYRAGGVGTPAGATIVHSNPSNPTAPIATQIIALTGLGLTDGCPVMIDQVDQ